jgi:hypothetical protein
LEELFGSKEIKCVCCVMRVFSVLVYKSRHYVTNSVNFCVSVSVSSPVSRARS